MKKLLALWLKAKDYLAKLGRFFPWLVGVGWAALEGFLHYYNIPHFWH